jgi:hypothetical protein
MASVTFPHGDVVLRFDSRYFATQQIKLRATDNGLVITFAKVSSSSAGAQGLPASLVPAYIAAIQYVTMPEDSLARLALKAEIEQDVKEWVDAK